MDKATTPPMSAAELRKTYVDLVTEGRAKEDDIHRRFQIGERCATCNTCQAITQDNRDPIGVQSPYAGPAGPVMDLPVHDGCDCEEIYILGLGAESPFF